MLIPSMLVSIFTDTHNANVKDILQDIKNYGRNSEIIFDSRCLEIAMRNINEESYLFLKLIVQLVMTLLTHTTC